MPDPTIWEIKGPNGVFELKSDHEPTPDEITKAVRAYGYQEMLNQQVPERSGPEGSAAWRGVAGAAEMLNPWQIAKGAYQIVRHPIETTSTLVGKQVEQGLKAVDLAREGRYTEAAGHGVAAMLPILGPVAADVGERTVRTGDVAGAVGSAIGLAVPVGIDAALSARAARNTGRAGLLEREAAQQVAERVLAPGNPKFKGRAQAIAPEVLARKLTGGRLELQEAADLGMTEAAGRIDAAIQGAGGIAARIPVQEVISGIRQAITDLQDSSGVALSAQAAKRIQALKDRITQVQALGGKQGMATFEDLRKIRDESYRIADEARGYEKAGNPAMADEGWAARESGSVIREVFARRSPTTAAANADYAFFKTLSDILDPAIGRPKSMTPSAGVTGGSMMIGATAGNLIGGKLGAFIGSTMLPWLRARVADSSFQLADAAQKMKLAQAMKAGDISRMQSIMVTWGKYGPKGATSPSESQPVPAAGTP